MTRLKTKTSHQWSRCFSFPVVVVAAAAAFPFVFLFETRPKVPSPDILWIADKSSRRHSWTRWLPCIFHIAYLRLKKYSKGMMV